ncbi:MAG: DNA alkylation repair protein [Tyzzerella sp.]|nr:DNA alkylation repair protein [Tyzzerella sp.]
MKELQQTLFSMQDVSYRDFHSKLMPTIDKETIIGIRTPQLRKFAKEFAKSDKCEAFLNALPHQYYEENNLHGFLIEMGKDYDVVVERIEKFLPYVDNWATCDMMRPKVFKKHLPELFQKIQKWIASDHVYTVRYGIGMLLSFYLDDAFEREHLEMVANIRSEEYYVNMMIAWYFATALAKQYEATLPYIEEKRLDTWAHNKAIQKAIESYRVTDEQKAYLRTWKIK